MSHAKDRARAKSGLIFRDGGIVKTEDWEAAHPTREMLAQKQAKVDEAVAEVVAKNAEINDKGIPKRYYCTACRRHHTTVSKVGKEHTNFYLKEA